MSWRGLFRPGMRAYFVPLLAGLALATSGFLPWVVVGDVQLPGIPEVAALWVVGLGVLAAVLATLSLITRKNSRHPLLILGLVALGIMFLSWRIMPRAVNERALTRSQAVAIVERSNLPTPASASVGSGIYLGLIASTILVGFGLTIVVRRASSTYAVTDPNDDVD